MSCSSLSLDYLKSGTLVLATVFFSSASFGVTTAPSSGSGSSSGGSGGGATSGSASGSSSTPQVVQAPTAAQISAQEQAKSLKGSAQQGQSNANTASTLGGVAIGAGVAILVATEGMDVYGWTLIAAGAATMVLSADAGNKAAMAGFQADQLKFNTAAPGTVAPPTMKAFSLPPAAVSAMNKANLKYDPVANKVTGPNGFSMTGAQAAAGDFSGTGMSKGDQALAKAKLADIMNEAKKQGTADGSKGEGSDSGEDFSGAGGGAGKMAKFNPNAFKFPGLGKGGAAGKNSRKPSSAAGLSKKHGSDSIGVAGDDIFGMMTRRYEAIATSDNFIETLGMVDPPSGGAALSSTANTSAPISGKPGPGH
jgi:hypothetical protein